MVRSAEITAALRDATTIIGPQVGFTPDNVSARSVRAGGAMDLIMARVDTDTIRLVGRWHSNAMLRYLHMKSQTFTAGARCVHGPTWRLCAYTTRLRGINPPLPDSRPLLGILWVTVGGLS